MGQRHCKVSPMIGEVCASTLPKPSINTADQHPHPRHETPVDAGEGNIRERREMERGGGGEEEEDEMVEEELRMVMERGGEESGGEEEERKESGRVQERRKSKKWWKRLHSFFKAVRKQTPESSSGQREEEQQQDERQKRAGRSSDESESRSSSLDVLSANQGFQRLILQHLWKLTEDVRELQYQSTINHNLLMQLTKGSQEDMALPEDTVLPLRNSPMLEELENRLSNNVELQAKLVRFLAVKGGKNIKDSIRRMLACLFSNDLSKQCNWTGLGQKISFKQLALKEIVHRAVRKNPATKETTEGTLQEVVSKFLKGAADREGGRKQRQEN